jgi:hypothetical protein
MGTNSENKGKLSEKLAITDIVKTTNYNSWQILN